MPFCVNCGAQNRDGARFCEACGKPVTQLVGGAQPPPPAPGQFQPMPAASEASGSAKMLVLVGVGIYAVAAVLTIMAGDMLDFILSLALAAGIYLGAYSPLAKGNLGAAKTGALAGGIAALVFVFFSFMNGSGVGALFNAAAAACMGLAWNSIKS
jgi:hypothetical protein